MDYLCGMSELLELVLNLVLDVASVYLEDWAGWRFYVPLLASLGIFGLINWLAPEGSLGALASWPVVLVGIGAGIVGEVCGGRC